jgi:hypothetical protein
LAEVVADWKNNAAGEWDERTMASGVGEGHDIRVPTRPGVVRAIQFEPGEKPFDPPTLFIGVPQRE